MCLVVYTHVCMRVCVHVLIVITNGYQEFLALLISYRHTASYLRRFLSTYTYGLAFRCLALIIGAFLVFGVLAMVGFQHLFPTCF